MNYTNLNITSSGRSFKYIIEYFDDPGINTVPVKYFSEDDDFYFFGPDQKNVSAKKNFWKEKKEESSSISDSFPITYNVSSFDLFFPRYAVETYNKNTFYVLTINTWINGTCVYLGSFLIDRRNATACEKGPRKFLDAEYYEYIRINTIDPFYLIYGDEWKEFRKKFCNEKENTEGLQKNDSAANINITLTPVEVSENIYVKLDSYDSSQSCLTIINKNDNFMHPVLSFNNEKGAASFDCQIKFNDVYKGNFDEYLKETYQIDFGSGDYEIKYMFVIGDKEDPYRYSVHKYGTPEKNTSFILDEFKFSGWDEYTDGMNAMVYTIVSFKGDDAIVMNSNAVPITKNIFRFLTDEPVRHIELNNISGMETYKFDVVNIIKNEIVNVERPNDYKSNIIKSVFVKTQEAANIVLHRSVTENIVINLDAYKNRVNSFTIKIGDTNFYEAGRINSGIVFKIGGSMLPDNNGLYYILNEDGELVTTGNYTIIK